MRRYLPWSLYALLSFPGAAQAVTGAQAAINPSQNLDIKTEPSDRDWKFFFAMSDPERKRLWNSHNDSGRKLKDWAWQWRLGWIKACTYNRDAYCLPLLANALADHAMVVRAEAATSLGMRFEGTKDAKIAKLLQAAYKNKSNVRNGKSLLVHQRIIFALRQIGGDGTATAKTLAQAYPETREYWQKLTQVAR